MSIWKDQSAAAKSPAPTPSPAPKDLDHRGEVASQDLPRRAAAAGKESIIAGDLTIEGKIEGAGNVRIAGRFKGDVHVQGNLTIEQGAKVTGAVRASTVTIGGELDGNIEAAARVELLETGVLNGDLKAGSLIVAAGSRMRGQVEFGWQEGAVPARPSLTMGTAAAS